VSEYENGLMDALQMAAERSFETTGRELFGMAATVAKVGGVDLSPGISSKNG